MTARLNLRVWAQRWPWEPEDLRSEHAPVLVAAQLPRAQLVADAHSPDGLASLGLAATYPLDAHGSVVTHERCQPIGVEVHEFGLRGVRCRSAQTPLGAGRELAWFPATGRSRAKPMGSQPFDTWYWS